jgi:hypothetical protein
MSKRNRSEVHPEAATHDGSGDGSDSGSGDGSESESEECLD